MSGLLEGESGGGGCRSRRAELHEWSSEADIGRMAKSRRSEPERLAIAGECGLSAEPGLPAEPASLAKQGL